MLFTVKKRDLKNMSVSCSNSFLNNEDNEKLTENSRVAPDNIIKVRILLNNTGEIALNDVSVESPLEGTYASKGASNLTWLQFVDISPTSSPGIKDKCTYSTDFNSIQCRNLSIPYTEELYIDYIVKVKNTIESDSQMVNVTKVFVEGTGIDYYCNSSIKTSQISNVCNNSTQSCEKVYRAPLEGEVSCSSSSECGAIENSTHLECFENSCVTVDGVAPSTCTDNNDCLSPSHLVCDGSACILVDGPGSNTCSSDLDCGVKSHLECRSNACTSVSGSGSSTCANDDDCVSENHLECVDSSCSSVEGAGKNLCSTEAECSLSSHLECVLESCKEVSGGGSNQCASDSDCASGVIVPAPDPSIDPEQDLPATGISGLLSSSLVSLLGVTIAFLLFRYSRSRR